MSEHAKMAAADLDHMARLRQERDAARADAAVLRNEIITWYQADGSPDFVGVEADFVWLAKRLTLGDHPNGAPLLAELDAARRVVVAARAALNGALFEYRRPLEEALEAYHAAATAE